MTPALSQLLGAGESEQVEFKGPRAAIDAVARDICGLLNQRGGTVLWGVDDHGKPVGLDDAGRRAQELNEYLARSLNPRPLLSVFVEEGSTKPLVVIDVPAGSDRPYSVGQEIWVRVGSKTLRASPDESSDLVQHAATSIERWERSVVPGFGIGDCDAEELAATHHDIADTGRFGADVPADGEELLQRLYLAKNGQLTNAAVVLFARDPRAWSPHAAVRVVSFKADAGEIPGGDWVVAGPALRIVKELVGIIQQRTGFSGHLTSARLVREDRPSYPVFALREGLVNAVVHRDYVSVRGRVRIDIYPDHLTISNPGKLPDGWSPGDLKKPHESLPGNPDIARVFYLRGLMEQLGRGTMAIVAACKQVGAKPPSWGVRRGIVSLTLYRAPEPSVAHELADRQRSFLEQVDRDVAFAVADYVRLAKVSERQARRDLAELDVLGLVARSGKGRATSYRRVLKRST